MGNKNARRIEWLRQKLKQHKGNDAVIGRKLRAELKRLIAPQGGHDASNNGQR